MSTSGNGAVATSEYRGETDVAFAQDASVGFRRRPRPGASAWFEAERSLEPIDYEAEIAERLETHEPMADVGGEIGNSRFGV